MNSGSAFTARASRALDEAPAEIEPVAMRDAARRRRHHDQLGGEEQRLLDAVRDEEEHLARRATTARGSAPGSARASARRARRAARPSASLRDRSRARARGRRAAACRRRSGRSARRRISRGRRAAAFRARSRRRSASATPRMRRPNSTFSMTLSHGISACFWNTTPRSAPGPIDRLAVEHDLAGRRLHEAGDARQQRRLAAARRAERDDEVAGVEREVDVGQRERRAAAGAGVVDADVADFELAHAARRSRMPSTRRRSAARLTASPATRDAFAAMRVASASTLRWSDNASLRRFLRVRRIHRDRIVRQRLLDLLLRQLERRRSPRAPSPPMLSLPPPSHLRRLLRRASGTRTAPCRPERPRAWRPTISRPPSPRGESLVHFAVFLR